MKLSLCLLAMSVIASALFSPKYFGTQVSSGFSTVHPAISGHDAGVFSPPLTAALANRGGLNRSPLGVTSVMAAAGDPELPRIYLDTTYVAPAGKTITVNAGGDFQAALNQAQPGDVIALQAGATFLGNFVLPNKSGAKWIVIRSSTPDANLPPPGTRVTPANSSLMPKLISPNSEPVVQTAAGAHHFRLIGLEIGVAAGVDIYNLVGFDADQTSIFQMPHDLIVDRCYIHGNATGNARRGVAVNSASTAIIDSYISNIHEVGADSQAICGWNGTGPFKIVNNYLEGAGENVLFGGADPSIQNLIPSDIEFRLNYVYKPVSWKKGHPSYAGTPWTVKNLLELKNAQRGLVDQNVFENNWAEAQNGFAILFTPVNQNGGSPWSVVQDITFTNNIVRHSGSGFNISGPDNEAGTSLPSQRIQIKNNLVDDINGEKWGSTDYGPADGRFAQIIGGPVNITFDHNTVFQSGVIVIADYAPSPGFIFRNNIVPHNLYGVIGANVGCGTEALNFYFPGAIFQKNVLVAVPGGIPYPPDNFLPTSFSQVGFVNMAGADYRLSATSPYRNAGTDGKDIGCQFGVTINPPPPSPTPTPTPTPTPKPTPDITPPIISAVTSSGISTTSATISWVTNENSNSQVEFGPTTAYNTVTPVNTALLTNHLVMLTNLSPGNLYHYRVKSKDATGNLGVSGDFTLTTLAAPVSGGNQLVIWTKLVNATLTGTTLRKTAGCEGCESTAISQQMITSGNGYLEIAASGMEKEGRIGLMLGNRTASASNIDYAIGFSGGLVSIRERGVYRMEMASQKGDVFRIAVENGVVKYYKNGAEIYRSRVVPTYPLVSAVALWTLKSSVTNVVIASSPAATAVVTGSKASTSSWSSK